MPADIRVLLSAADKTSAAFKSAIKNADDYNNTMLTMDEYAKESGEAIEGFKGTLAKIVGVAVAVGVALMKAFDLAQEGAAIAQTRESFEGLLRTIGAAPDLFERLATAAGGTVTDFELMSSTSILLAGASEEMAVQLAEATPRLLEIARAAIKLNPALGSVTQLYSDLARGIKRSSPMIIDNTGLLVKIGPANEAYAASLGKTVEELTATERSMALLNATMEAGDVLINQVGGSVESMTDSYARARTVWTEQTNEMKENLHDVFEPLVVWFTDMTRATMDYTEAVEYLGGETSRAAIATNAYAKRMDMTREEVIAAAEAQRLLAAEMETTQVDRLITQNVLWAAGLNEGVIPALEGTTLSTDIVKASLREMNDQMLFTRLAADLSGESQLMLARDMGILNEETYATLTAAALLKDQMDAGTLSAGYYDAAIRSLTLAHQQVGLWAGISAPTGDVYGEAVERAEEARREQIRIERGYQHGGRGVVPAGFESDSYMIGLSSGEEFAVAPRGRGLGGGGMTFIYSPMISLADEAEAEGKIRPMIQGVIREMIAERG